MSAQAGSGIASGLICTSAEPMRKENVKRLFVLLMCWCCQAGLQAAEATSSLQIIAHPAVPVVQLSQAQLRSIYLMRQVVWPNGVPVRVFVLPARSSFHSQFCRDKLQLFPYQLERTWQKLTFSGTGTPPTELATPEAMLAAVSSTAGAIGYIETTDETQRVKVIEIKP